MDLSKRINTYLSEDELIVQLKKGNVDSFEFIVREYGGYLLIIAKRYLTSEADAQDAVQDTYLHVFSAIVTFEGRSSLKSWLHRIVINISLMKIRSNKRKLVELIDDNASFFDVNGKRIETETEITLSLEKLMADDSQREYIKTQITQLPQMAKNLLLLKDIEGYSTKEIAELLDISLPSVKTGLHRARLLLKKKIEHQLR